MFSNMKLATKIASGFSLIVLIMLALGNMAIWNMKTVQTESDKLSKEYVPEVEIAADLERNSLLTMYAIRGYSFTSDKSFLEAGKKTLSAVEADIKKAYELAAISPHLEVLKANTTKAEAYVKEYKDLLTQTTENIDRMAASQTRMNESAAKFLESCYKYLTTQNDRLVQEIKDKFASEKLQQRYLKTILINDVLDFGNATRIAAWKGAALNDPSYLQEAEKNFPEMKKKLNQLRPITTKEEDLKAIDEVEKSVDAYAAAMEEYQTGQEKMVEINKKLGVAGDNVMNIAGATAHKGMEQTGEIATNASATLAQSLWMLIIGLIVATALGVIMAFTVTTAISRPLKIAIDGIKNATAQVGSASEQLSSAAQQLSSGANEQASAIEETSASLEEMLGMVQNNVTNAKKANELSTEVKNISEQGNESMTKLQSAMGEILSSNDKIEQLVRVIGEIGEKTKVMDEIVFQTKLLSFNASVEAERAGEHGRGFAVVAQEVGNLAQMSGKSAQEISQILSDSIKQAEAITTENKKKVEIGNSYVLESGKILREITSSASQVVEGASQVSSASEEQATGIKQITTAMTNLDRAVQENAATAEETASTSEELNAQADSLNTLVQSLVSLMDGKSGSMQPPSSSQVRAVTPKYVPSTSHSIDGGHKGKVLSIASAKKSAPRPKNDGYKAVVGSDIGSGSSEGGWEEL